MKEILTKKNNQDKKETKFKKINKLDLIQTQFKIIRNC
jgi:hypothetical protein